MYAMRNENEQDNGGGETSSSLSTSFYRSHKYIFSHSLHCNFYPIEQSPVGKRNEREDKVTFKFLA
jgi:hypothetical protein